jgi:hypothetical protein
VSAGYEPSETSSEPAVASTAQEVGLASGPAAVVPTGRLQRLVRGVPWRVATIALGIILTVAWMGALVWLLHWLLSSVI